MKDKKTPPAEKDAAEYYRLNTQAVEDLANANEQNSPPVSEQELRKYKSGPKLTIAGWVKLLAVKWWFYAACCFFFLWGLGTYISSVLDQMAVTALAMGFVTDLLTNNVLRFVEKKKGANDRWMMYPKKRFLSLPLNILHGCTVMFLVYTAYNMLNKLLIDLSGLEADSVPLGVEPILFGLFALGADMLLIGCKHIFQNILADARQKANHGG